MDTARYIARHVVSLPKSGIRDFFEIVAGMKDVISLGIGEPDFDTPWHIREAGIYALEKGKTHYTSNLGLIELRRAISRYVEKNFSISYQPEDEIAGVHVMLGAMHAGTRAMVGTSGGGFALMAEAVALSAMTETPAVMASTTFASS